MITIEVDGVRYNDFVSASATIQLDALSNSFKFATASDEAKPLPFQGGEACKIFVDGVLQVTGFIEKVDVSTSDKDHSITMSGRDRTADIVDSTIGAMSDLRAPITLSGICRAVIAHIGSDVQVFNDELPEQAFNEAEDLAAPEPGTNAFEFLQKFARKRAVLLTSDANGNMIITKSSGLRVAARIVNRVRSEENNVTTFSVGYDLTGLFRLYEAVGQMNPITLNKAGDTDLGALSAQGGGVSDLDVRAGRQFVFVPENPGANEQMKERATWEANVRRARSRTYGCTVHGFRNETGDLWTTNRLVKVIDEFAGIEGDMLINTVNFNFTNEEGSATTLTLVNRNAYTIALTEPKADKTGVGFIA